MLPEYVVDEANPSKPVSDGVSGAGETSPKNHFNATVLVNPTSLQGTLAPPTGSDKSYTPVGKDVTLPPQTQELDGKFPKLSSLLTEELTIIATSVINSRENAKGEFTEDSRTIVIPKLSVRYIQTSQDSPLGLNKFATVRLMLVDGRSRWSQLSNFSDDINTFKGIDANGFTAYTNDSVWNPSADTSERRAWSASDVVSYLASLMEGSPIKGTRALGFSFEFDLANRVVADVNLDDNRVEGLSARGANPALVLYDLLKRWGLVIIYPHHGRWYIDKATRAPLYPGDTVQGRVTNLVAESSNAQMLRARRVVVQGGPLKLQEGFSFAEHVDFDYVVPFEGSWLQLDYVWKSILAAQVPNPDGYDDAERAGMLTPEERDRLALAAAAPAGTDYEVFVAEAGFVESLEKSTAEITLQLTKAMTSVADNGFKYIRLRKDGSYGQFRRPLPNLVSVSNTGDNNRPIVISDGWQQTMVRGAASGIKEFDLVDFAGEALDIPGFNLADASDQIASEFAKRETKTKNLNNFYHIQEFPQESSLVDVDALIFTTGKRMIYPAERRESTPISDVGFNPLTAASAGSSATIASDAPPVENADKIIQEFSAYQWKRSESISMLVASTFAGASFTDEGTPGGAYYSTFESKAGYDGTAFLYQDYIQLELIFSRLNFDGGYSLIDYRDDDSFANQSLTATDIRDNSPMDAIRERFAPGFPESLKRVLDGIDAESERLAASYFNSSRYTVGAEYAWPGFIVPRGGPSAVNGSQEGGVIQYADQSTIEDDVSYSSQLSTIFWYAGDDGTMTRCRFNSNAPFSPAAAESQRAHIEWLNQQRQYNDTKSLGRLMKQAERMSGGRHDG
jgi:hypothetical protein